MKRCVRKTDKEDYCAYGIALGECEVQCVWQRWTEMKKREGKKCERSVSELRDRRKCTA